jgi:hypothetical protein
VVGSKAYSYGSTGTTELDDLLGYPDLKKRGFIVKDEVIVGECK